MYSGLSLKADIARYSRPFAFAPNSKAVASLDHHVSAGEKRRRYHQTKRVDGPGVDDQRKFGRLLDRNVGKRTQDLRHSEAERLARSILTGIGFRGMVSSPLAGRPADG